MSVIEEARIKNNPLKRSKDTVKMIRTETLRDGKVIEIVADLPIGKGWNAGNGTIDWMNLNIGWQPYDKFMSDKHEKAIAAEKMRAEIELQVRAEVAAKEEVPHPTKKVAK